MLREFFNEDSKVFSLVNSSKILFYFHKNITLKFLTTTIFSSLFQNFLPPKQLLIHILTLHKPLTPKYLAHEEQGLPIIHWTITHKTPNPNNNPSKSKDKLPLKNIKLYNPKQIDLNDATQ